MIAIVLHKDADIVTLKRMLTEKGLWVRLLRGSQGNIFWIDPSSTEVNLDAVKQLPGVVDILQSDSEHPLIDKQGPTLSVAGIQIGSEHPPCLIGGPCSIESEEQILRVAAGVSNAGCQFLRGGAFKPRTSPYSFQGHGSKALSWLRTAAEKYSLRVVTEVLDTADVEPVAEHADLIQIGARNMYNYALLKSVGRMQKPILLKRAFSATVEEWLLAAEYCLLHGASGVIFCERGIRTFDLYSRNLLDLSAVAFLSHIKRLPVIVDPSHASGRRDLILPLSQAALAAGAAGVMIETHESPYHALSDGSQALTLEEFSQVVKKLVYIQDRP